MLDAPFPWFGGKRRVADEVWSRFGAVDNYVEPFFGSGAVLLGRPDVRGNETINDLDGYVANFWRAIKARPDEVAAHADWPVSENDLHARHVWLVKQRDSLRARLEGDPDWCDAKIAGWWVWGISCWIGGGFCSGDTGPWWTDDSGRLVHLGNGRGVSRRLVHLGNGRGVSRRLVHLGDNGQGVSRKDALRAWFGELSARLERVRVASGDWSRVCGPSVTFKHGVTAVFLDPPYSAEAGRDECYSVDDFQVAHAVRAWALDMGKRDDMRIALCGYDGEHDMPGWSCWAWKAHGGYGSQGDGRGRDNVDRERVWFSPACLCSRQTSIFDRIAARA
jgi:hypothetical protein